ncbi:hypothetical protein J6590_009407 [Homalodisca vitripennis]|nr:hypothetical protein J6590_009407 [Homalodisca vitripennis]
MADTAFWPETLQYNTVTLSIKLGYDYSVVRTPAEFGEPRGRRKTGLRIQLRKVNTNSWYNRVPLTVFPDTILKINTDTKNRNSYTKRVHVKTPVTCGDQERMTP